MWTPATSIFRILVTNGAVIEIAIVQDLNKL